MIDFTKVSSLFLWTNRSHQCLGCDSEIEIAESDLIYGWSRDSDLSHGLFPARCLLPTAYCLLLLRARTAEINRACRRSHAAFWLECDRKDRVLQSFLWHLLRHD